MNILSLLWCMYKNVTASFVKFKIKQVNGLKTWFKKQFLVSVCITLLKRKHHNFPSVRGVFKKCSHHTRNKHLRCRFFMVFNVTRVSVYKVGSRDMNLMNTPRTVISTGLPWTLGTRKSCKLNYNIKPHNNSFFPLHTGLAFLSFCAS